VTQAVADRHTDGWTDRHCATIRASLACTSQAKNANGLDTGLEAGSDDSMATQASTTMDTTTLSQRNIKEVNTWKRDFHIGYFGFKYRWRKMEVAAQVNSRVWER